MIGSSVTISLVPEARGGPFVFWDHLAVSCAKAAEFGFDAIELFPPSADAVDRDCLREVLDEHHLRLAAVGTGAGWLLERLSLTAADPERRERAGRFVRSVIDLAGGFGAPAIIGSMQGRHGGGIDRATALGQLRTALAELGQHASQHGTYLLFEPLNRYETNLANTIEQAVRLLPSGPSCPVKLLADLFHMNIEEVDLAAAIRAGGDRIGHVHLADSNRQPAGAGHTDFRPIATALRDMEFGGYVSAEALPLPNSDQAARMTIDAFRTFFR